MTCQSNELLSIISLQEAESGLKQWAPYHYIARMDGSMAGTAGWLNMLKMTVQMMTVQVIAFLILKDNRAYLIGVSHCPFLWRLVAQWLFLNGSSALVTMTTGFIHITFPHQVKGRGTISTDKVDTRTGALSRVSPRGARSVEGDQQRRARRAFI